MMVTVVTLPAMPCRLKKPSNVTATILSSLKSNSSTENSATLPWAKPAPVRRLAFVLTVRGGRVRVVTAYSMTPQQHEIYEEA
jgi:hypothetical protein